LKYTHIFWDFNGTILSDMQAGVDSVNKMLADRDLPVIPDIESYRRIFDFPIREYYRGLGFDFDREPYEVLAPIWVELYNENSKKSEITEGFLDVINCLKGYGVSQVVFSATEHCMLCGQLKELKIFDLFDEIIGLDNIHAESKLHLAKLWREKNPDAVILYVGDTVHDAENASLLSADCLLYSKGHQSREKLEACSYPIIDSIKAVLDYIE